MKAEELRIGNWVLDNRDCYVQVYSITSEINNDDLYYLYKPIPLTEEILVKIGKMFIFSHGVNCEVFYNLYDNHLYFDSNFALCNRISWLEIKYLHQLQNLYFALANEELTIKFD